MAYIKENILYKSQNILNLDGVDLDQPIFRVFSFDRLMELFINETNTLVKPALWDDPFENVIFRQTAIRNNGETIYFDQMRELYYGQCWTMNTEESDALWRIYSPKKNGVRVQTTIRKLFDSYYNYLDEFAMSKFYLGKIIYETSQGIQDFFENPKNLGMIRDVSGCGSIQTLLVKRTAFQHENEIRILYCANPEFDDLNQQIYQYYISPNDLIDDLLFDPRFDEPESQDYNRSVQDIRNLGITISTEKSNLYKIPNFNLRLDI